jgi:mycothiol S-conjugate amidase
MADELCLLSVHAHPDDESSKGASTVAKYHAEGVRTVLVTCTGGEEGDILNPAMESPEVRENLHQVRLEELNQAVKIIGYDELVLLGYRDSGMADTDSNAHPECFAQAPLDEAVGRLVAAIRRHRPQVIITYNEEQQGYRHPDHLRVHEISVLAFDAAGDPDAFPEAGEPFQPLKLYYNSWAREQFLARHHKYVELGLESPFQKRIEEGWLERRQEGPEPTTRVDLRGFELVRIEALLAHRTQIDPESRNWFGLPEEIEKELHAFEPFVLAKSLVGPIGPEEDLFAGIRKLVNR